MDGFGVYHILTKEDRKYWHAKIRKDLKKIEFNATKIPYDVSKLLREIRRDKLEKFRR